MSSNEHKESPTVEIVYADSDLEGNDEQALLNYEQTPAADTIGNSKPVEIIYLQKYYKKIAKLIDGLQHRMETDQPESGVKPTLLDIKSLLTPYKHVNKSMEELFAVFKIASGWTSGDLKLALENAKEAVEDNTPEKAKKESASKPRSGSKSKDKEEPESPKKSKEDNNAKLIRESNDEVRFLGFNYRKVPTKTHLKNLNNSLKADGATLKTDEEIAKLDHSGCIIEIATTMSMLKNLNTSKLIVRFRQGAIFARQMEHADKERAVFSQMHAGLVYVDWKSYYAKRFGIESAEINIHITFYEHVLLFPALVYSEKSWYWMKEHMKATRLQTQIKAYYKEHWERIESVDLMEEHRARGYQVGVKEDYEKADDEPASKEVKNESKNKQDS